MKSTIVMVEDDPNQRGLLRAILGTQYQLLEAADVETAWHWHRSTTLPWCSWTGG